MDGSVPLASTEWLTCEVSNLFLCSIIYIIGRAKRAPHWGVQSSFRVISESAVALYVGLSGIVRNLIQKSTG